MSNPDKRKDHFVARTYLKRFAQKGMRKKYILNVYDRTNKKYITPSLESICCEIGWDIIDNAPDKYILRKFLQQIEPGLGNAIDRILNKNLYLDDRCLLSMYLAIVFLLNPEFLNNAKINYEKITKASLDILIDNGTIKIPPEIEKILGGKHNIDVAANIDCIKTFIAKMLSDIALDIYSAPWIIITTNSENEFITSDKPFYFMCCPHNYNIYPKYIPLDPKHLLLTLPPKMKENKPDFDKTPKFNIENVGVIHFVNIDSTGVDLFNKYTISNASRFIIVHSITEELKKTIKENIKYKTSMINIEMPCVSGKYIISTVNNNRKIKDKNKDFNFLMKILLNAS